MRPRVIVAVAAALAGTALLVGGIGRSALEVPARGWLAGAGLPPTATYIIGAVVIVRPMVELGIKAQLIGGDGKATPFNYRLRLTDGKWKVVDIYLNGYVSQIALRRADYASTVASAGAAGLAKKINDLADKQMGGG